MHFAAWGLNEGPWPACCGPVGRCAGGAAGVQMHCWGYVHQPAWPGASEVEWGAESAPLAAAKPGLKGAEASESTEGWEKIFDNIWTKQ